MHRWSEKRHETVEYGTATTLNFKGSGEMKWPQRGSKGLAPGAGCGGAQHPAKPVGSGACSA
jgi:hypothetical protein